MSSSPSTSEAELPGDTMPFDSFLPVSQGPTAPTRTGQVTTSQPVTDLADALKRVRLETEGPVHIGTSTNSASGTGPIQTANILPAAFDGTHQQVQAGLQAAGTYVTPVQPYVILIPQPVANQPQPVGQQHSHIGQPVNTGGFSSVVQFPSYSSASQLIISLMSSPAQRVSPYSLPPNQYAAQPMPTATTTSATQAGDFQQTALNHLAQCTVHHQWSNPSAPPLPLNGGHQGDLCEWCGGHQVHLCEWCVDDSLNICGLTFSDDTELMEHVTKAHIQLTSHELPEQEDGNVHI